MCLCGPQSSQQRKNYKQCGTSSKKTLSAQKKKNIEQAHK
jgi:hypothetical protein